MGHPDPRTWQTESGGDRQLLGTPIPRQEGISVRVLRRSLGTMSKSAALKARANRQMSIGCIMRLENQNWLPRMDELRNYFLFGNCLQENYHSLETYQPSGLIAHQKPDSLLGLFERSS